MNIQKIINGIKNGKIVSNKDTKELEKLIEKEVNLNNYRLCLTKGKKKVYNYDCTYIICENDELKGIYHNDDAYELDYFSGNLILSSDSLTTLVNINTYDYYDIEK